jgi:hypothetical protein
MPVIHIEFDDKVVSDDEMKQLCDAVQQIVSSTTRIEDVSVYANSARIKVKCAPIEIFVRISAHKVPDLDALLGEIKKKLSIWKNEHRYKHPVNLTLTRMDWKFELNI